MKTQKVFEIQPMDDAMRTLFLVMLSTTRGQKILNDMEILHGVTREFPLIEETNISLPEGDYFLVSTGNGHLTGRDDMDDIVTYGKLWANVYVDYNIDNRTYDYYIRFK